MAGTNILLFDESKSHIMDDATYASNAQRTDGVQQGVASSMLQNKFQYQVSLVAYAIAMVMIENGKDANDADEVATFVQNLSDSLVQKVVDKADQTEAEGGLDDSKYMTALRVKQAIAKFAPTGPEKASIDEAKAGTIDTKWVSPFGVSSYVTNRVASTEEAKAGTDTNKLVTPSGLSGYVSNRLATSAEAQAGVEATHLMTPALVKVAIDALSPGGGSGSTVSWSGEDLVFINGDTGSQAAWVNENLTFT